MSSIEAVLTNIVKDYIVDFGITVYSLFLEFIIYQLININVHNKNRLLPAKGSTPVLLGRFPAHGYVIILYLCI